MSNIKIMPLFISGVVGAVIVIILGFSMGWLITSGGANAQARESAEMALKDEIVPVCLHQFNSQSDATEKLAELRALGQWEREEFLTDAGLARLPGSASTVQGVARECAVQLLEKKS